MKTTKKALSVLLAVIMIMSSMSVCFGTFGPVITASAADNTTAVNNFVSAVDEYAKKVGKFTEFGYSYDNKNYVKTWTYNATYWSEFNIVCNVIDKLHAAVMGLDEYTVCATHNNNKLCGDGYNSSTQKNKCTDWGYVKDALIKAMGTNYKTLQSTASIDYLLDAVLNYKEVPEASGDDPGVARPANGKDKDAGSFEKSSSLPAQLWNDVIINAPSNAKDQIIAAAATIAEIPADYTTQYYYRLGLQRCNQYKSSECQDKDGTKFHMAIQDQSGKAQTVAPKSNATATIDKSTLEAAQTAFGNTYKSYFATTDKNGVLALNSDETSLNKILADIQDKKAKAEAAFGTDVYNKYLSGYPYARTVKNIEEALVFLGFQEIIDKINGIVAVDYSSYNSTQLAGHLASLEEAYASYKGLSDADKDDILATYDFDPAEVDAKIAEINAAYTRLLVAEQLDAINEHLNAYENKWTIEDVDNDNDAERLNYNTAWAAYLIVEQDYNKLKTLDKAVIAEVAGADFFGRVEALYNHLAFLSTAANYNDQYTPKYREFYASIKPNVPSQDTATLLSALKNYDTWYAELRSLIEGMAAGLSPEVAELLFDEVKDDMLNYMNNAYVVLNARVETQINLAYDLYTAHKEIYGPTVHYVSLESYLIVTDSIGKIDTPAYEFMKSTPNFSFNPETVTKYNELQELLLAYDKFADSMGFDSFYHVKIADFEREDTIDDNFRQNTDKDGDGVGEYITNDAQIEKIIKLVDTALTDANIAGALGLDLGTMLTDLVEGAIISDSFINTVVNMLYPLVLKEFGRVFANDLPATAEGMTVNYVRGLHDVFVQAGFEVYPDLLATELGKSPRAASYTDTIDRLNAAYTEALEKYPGVGAQGTDAYLKNDTPDEKDGKYSLAKTAWDSDALYEVVLDDDGNPVIDEETGEVKKQFALTWGIDAAKESGEYTDAELKELFYQTFDDAVEGLKPLLLALIANKDWFASQQRIAWVKPALSEIKVGLELSATANSGYANLLVPIYEALGVPYTSVSDVETVYTNDTNTKNSQDVALIIKAILEPIFTLVGRIGDAPLDTILGVLPNLCYALQAGMVTPLLSMLRTTIAYYAPLSGSLLSGCASPPEGSVPIDVGTMLDIPILDDINRDGLNALLTLLGIEGLPPINQALIACLGDLTKIDSERKEAVYSIEAGKGYHIIADKADVLAYLAEYLLTAIGQPGVLDALMGLLGGKKEEAPAEGEESTTPEEGEATEEETSDLLTDILANLSSNPKAAIAAIVELLNFNEYQTKMLYDWYNGTNYEASTVEGFNPATEIYLNVNNDWTREKSEYLYNNLETIINAVIAMIPEKEEAAEGEDANAPETVAEGDEVTEGAEGEAEAAKTLGSILGDLIGGLYSDETLTSLAAVLGKLDLNALLAGEAEETPAEGEDATEPETPETVAEGEETTDPETPAEGGEATEEEGLDINALIKNLLGIDLGQFATLYGDIAEQVEATKDSEEKYVHDFGVNAAENKKAKFVNELVNMLAPLNKVLDFLLAGGDLTIFDGKAKVTLYGSDGYNTAIIPLLEALGCAPVAAATGSDALKATLNALIAKIDALVANPVDTIFNLLPGLVYFLTSNGLSTFAQNLLKPALVVIETIRPIIDVMDILNNIEIGAKEEAPAEGEDADAPETVEEGEEATEEAKKTLGSFFGGSINLRALDANFVIDLVSGLLGLNLTGLKTIFYDVAAALTKKEYTSASTLQTEWKTAEFNEEFDQVDLLTVLLSFVVEWIAVPENGAAIDKLAKKEGIGAAIANIIKGAEITYETPKWMYFFDTEAEFLDAVANGMVIPSTLAALQYPNDWNKETAAYIAENLPVLVDMIIGLINAEKTDDEGNALPTTLSALLTDLIGGVFSAKTLNDLVGMITGLLENVADELLAAGGYLLNVDLVGLKGYTASEDIDTIDEFAAELASVLTTYAPGIVELLFLGNDYRFFNKSDKTDSIVISGGNGYAEGLALILEALGCENLPAATGETTAIVEGVFASLAARINAILAKPVEEILELLPNLIFFLNANGAGVALGNLLKPVNAILGSINGLLEKPISLADLLTIKIYEKDENGKIVKDEEGNDKVEKEIKLDLEKLSLANVVEIVEGATELDLTVVEDYLVNFCVGKIVSYDSVSVNDAYKMTEFAKEDVITIILTIALIFVQNEDNAKALDELIGTEIISGIKTVFESAPVQYKLPEWYALDWDTVDYEKKTVGVVQSALTYPNDWTAEKSLYLADNLAELVDAVIGMIEVNGVKYKSLAALIDANVNIYTPDLFATIQKALGDLLGGLEGDLQKIVNVGFGAADKLLNADIQGLLDYDASGVNDKASFVAALTGMLMEVEGIVEWLLLGKDYELFVDDKNNNGEYDEGEAIITLNGAEGYAQGLSLILEALGVKDLPAATGETEAIVNGVLKSVFNRVDEILANPVDEVIDILPNVIYFINANGLAAAVNNLAGAFNALALKLKTFGLNITLEDLLNIEKLLKIYEKDEDGVIIVDEDGDPVVKDLAIGLDKLNLLAVLEVVEEMTGLDLTGVADIFVGFALGRVQGYTGINGELNAMMGYDEGEAGRFNKGDMITLVVTAAMLVLNAEGNAAKLDELLKTNGIVEAIKGIFEGAEITYATPNWNYMDGVVTKEGITEYVNAIVSYPNDWTEEKAQYLATNLPTLVDTVIKMVEINGVKYDSLAALLQANVNVFTADTLNSLVGLITGLLKDIDDGLLEAAGVLLGADVVGLKAYKAPDGIDTVEEFAIELANVLNKYAKGVVEWLLLGKDYKFFVKENEKKLPVDAIVINGAQGYAEGLALLLEALGCKNLPEVYGVENLDTAATVTAVLKSLAARINEILEMPVERVIEILPNLIYFLDADGVDAVITNTTAALTALVGKLSTFGISLDINSLVNLPALMGIEDKYEEGDDVIALNNLTLRALLKALSLMTGLDFTELQNVLVPFAIGEAVLVKDSVSKNDTYKMVYKSDYDKHDMLSVIVSAALRMFFAGTETSNKNAAKLDEMLGTNIVSALKDVFASVEITYATPDWNYMEGIQKDNVIEYVNAIVSYPNDWTEAKAQYLADNLPALVDTVIGMLEINGKKYESLEDLLSELLADSKIFSAKTLNDLVGLLTGLLGDIDAKLLDAAGVLLGADINGLKAYKAPDGIDTVEEFAIELANVLNKYAKGVVEWLLLGNDYTFFVKEVKNGVPVDFITINGAQGYAEGLALLLEALGCKDLPAATITEENTTAKIVKAVLTSLAARIDEILANPVEEVLDLLPNLIYFLDANGVAVVIKNTTAALTALINKLSVFGIKLDINSLVDLPKLMGIADKYEEGEDKIGLDNLTLVALLRAVSLMTGLDLTELQNVLVPFAIGEAVLVKDSVSKNDTYKMVYKNDLDKHDMLSVIVSAALRMFFAGTETSNKNAAKLDEMLGTEIISALKDVFASVEITYATPDWNYMEGIQKDNVIEYVNAIVSYPNDWTEAKAQYLAANLPALVDTVIKMIEINGVKYESLSALLNTLLADANVFSTKNLQAIVDLIAGLLKDIDDGLLDAAGVLLGVDVVGLKAYKAPNGIDTVEEFAIELANVLNKYAKGVVEWLLLGKDYKFFVKEVATNENGEKIPVDFIVINGANGYAEGLALLLEALGCEDLPATGTTEEIVSDVLASLAARIDAILAKPVEEVLDLLPNLIYFLDADGVDAVITNTTAALTALVGKLSTFGISLDINSLVNLPALMGIEDKYAEGDDVIALNNLTLRALLKALSLMTGLDLTELQNVLVPFALGEAVKYDSVSANDAYKMVYKNDLDKHDMLSVIVTAALKVVVENEDNAAKLDEMLNTDIVSALKDVFASVGITYVSPNWNYMDGKVTDGAITDYVNAIVAYPNDWTEEKAEYLAANLPALVDTVIKMIEINGVKYESLSALLNTLLADANVFSTKNLQAIVDLIAGLLKDIDDGLLEAAGVLLGVDVVGLKAYKAPEDIDTAAEFAAELANVLNTYAKGVIEWLLLGKDYKFFVKEVATNENGEKIPVDFIVINGANGYAEGLALLLEALGCEDLPATGTTEEIVSDVLASLAARIDAILAKPVEEVIDLLPNLIYFLNTNGVAAVVDNTIAALTALLTKLEAFGLELNINELVNLKKLMKLEDTNAAISLDNLTLEALFEALGLMLGLDLSELTNVLVPFAIGEAVKYDSVSKNDTYKMVYKNDLDKHDMLSVIVSAALRMFFAGTETSDKNAAKLDEMLGTEIISALKDVFASVEILYTAPNWNYPLADNGTVDAMKYSITYPNNWTEATAEAVTEFLLSDDFDTLITGLIDKNYATLSDLLKAKVNVFTSDNLQSIVDLIANLLDGIDNGLLDAAGVLLGANVTGLKAYKAPEGITTVDAFATELANVLNTYAKGVVEWLLLGNDYTFFIKEVKNGVPVDFITINGAHGYAEGLALLLEALGCEELPTVYDVENLDTEATVKAVLESLANRINEIFADPVNEIVDLLPNLFYFLNTNGVAAVVDNTLAAVTALLEKLSVFGLKVDLNELVNLKKLMKIEDTDATISLDNLSMADLLQAVSYMIKDLDITHIKEILVGFALGKVEAYTSVSKEVGETKKMVYATEFDKYDMVTVVANILLITIADEDNAAFVKNLVGEDIYAVILDILNLSENEAPIQYMDWQGVPEKVGQIFNALETSPTYKGFEYGPLYTEEMAQYIADNIGEFINNIIYLLGLEINGVNVESLEGLLNNLVGGSLYNSGLVITIRDALAGLATSIEGLEVEGKNVGKLIVKVLAAAEIADLKAIGKVNVPAFEDNKAMFVESLCNVLEPAYGLLTWLLTDKDLAFFVDLEKNDFITLPGAEGYNNGIGLLLEAIGCEPTALAKGVEGEALVKAILNPLLNRLDEIFANPAEEILAVLTNVIYFINSNGIDVVIKNTLNAVYTVLAAIEPIAKVDLYKLVGLDAYVTLSAEELIDMLLSKLEVAGFDFTAISVDLFSELTIGKLTQYTSISAEGANAYKMVYDAEYADEADMVTAIMRLVITFILTDNNREVLVDLLKDVLGMSADAEKYVRALLKAFADNVVGKKGEDLRLGMDSVLATIYYIFYGLDTGVDGTVAGKKDLDKLWSDKIKELNENSPSENTQVGDLITDIFDIIFDGNNTDDEETDVNNGVLDPEGVASNGFLAFFQKIANFFKEIGEFFKNLFSFGK